MAISGDYSVYNDYSVLFDGLSGSAPGSQTNKLSQSLQKLSGLQQGAGFNSSSDKYVTSGVHKYLTDLKSEADNLSSSLNDLLGKNKSKTSSFNELTVVSSNNETLSVSTGSGYKNSFKGASVEVSQIASGQINEGAKLTSSGKALVSGNYQFEIEVNGKSHQISFKVNAGDNNETIQRAAAAAVNNKNIGVTASVQTDSGSKTSTLKLESVNTGDDAKNRFTVRDTSLGGGAAAALGIDQIKQSASDALYSVNGEFKTSKTNKIDLGEGVTAALKKASLESVDVTVSKDPKNAINKVRSTVNSFNAMLAAAEDNKEDRGGARLLNQLKGLSVTYKTSLERVGISVSGDGYLSIDAGKMEKAAEDGSLEKMFSPDNGANYGFAARLSNISSSVSADPTDYVSSKELYSESQAQSGSGQNGDKSGFSYLQSARYNSIMNVGMLFDYMF